MSNPEEIAENIVKRGYTNITSDEEYAHWVNVVANDIEKHTAQTLDRLKGEVRELSDEINAAINSQRAEDREVPDWLKGQLHAYVNVLEKIEEVSDE